nr:solute carrier family 23 member 2-like [Biomphalaria glabrata]
MEDYTVVQQIDLKDQHILIGNGREGTKLLSTSPSEEDEEKDQKEDITVTVELEDKKPLIYRISEVPPPHLLIFFALQQCLLSIGSPLAVTIIVAEVICAQQDEAIKTYILSSSFLMIGVSTFAMSTFGVRLPVFQGPASTYLIPLIAMSTLPEWKCPNLFKDSRHDNITVLMADVGNGTVIPAREVIENKLAQLSGSLMLAGGLHFLIGATGLIGILIRYIGPITIVPTVTLVGLFIYKAAVKFCETNWLLSCITCAVNLILSLYLSKRQTPIPMWNRKQGFHILWFPFHQVFSVLLSIIIGWIVALILTVAGTMSDDPNSIEQFARTDARLHIVHESDWFIFPYPGKVGSFSFSLGAFISFFMATIGSVLDSIGDYNAIARICRVPPPPRYAFNRGIAVEGLMSFFSGAMGCCHATVSYGGNIGAMGITRVVSRSVFQMCGLLFILFAVFAKLGAVFIAIPYPVIGGSSLISMGIFIGVVLSYLQTVDLNSQRNLAIIGTALLIGMMLPYWITNNPQAIDTGSDDLNNAITMLLSNPSFVGGTFAFVLDNTVPGTLKERGMMHQLREFNPDEFTEDDETYEDGLETYDLISSLPSCLANSSLARRLSTFNKRKTSVGR